MASLQRRLGASGGALQAACFRCGLCALQVRSPTPFRGGASGSLVRRSGALVAVGARCRGGL